MPRTRSTASPPPRRSGSSDRPRSIRNLTHRPKKSVKPVKKVEEVAQELPLDHKQRLIQQHTQARAERHQSTFGATGMVAVIATCILIFVAWWYLPDFFAPPEPIVPFPAAVVTPSSTVRFVPQSSTSSTPAENGFTTTTERRLLLPLTSPSSTDSLR
jgi:hypothetical protein